MRTGRSDGLACEAASEARRCLDDAAREAREARFRAEAGMMGKETDLATKALYSAFHGLSGHEDGGFALDSEDLRTKKEGRSRIDLLFAPTDREESWTQSTISE